jgi:hypothetical protein
VRRLTCGSVARPERDSGEARECQGGDRRIAGLPTDRERLAVELRGTLVVAGPERQESRLEVRVAPRELAAALGRERLVEPSEAFVEALVGHPQRRQSDGEAQRIVGPAVVDEPLEGGGEVIVLVLELGEECVGIHAT